MDAYALVWYQPVVCDQRKPHAGVSLPEWCNMNMTIIIIPLYTCINVCECMCVRGRWIKRSRYKKLVTQHWSEHGSHCKNYTYASCEFFLVVMLRVAALYSLNILELGNMVHLTALCTPPPPIPSLLLLSHSLLESLRACQDQWCKKWYPRNGSLHGHWLHEWCDCWSQSNVPC